MNLLLIPLLMAHLAAGAPTEITIHTMPLGTKVWLPPPDNSWGKGFTFQEYKLLLQMDGDIYTARQQLELYVDIELKYKGIIHEKDAIIATLNNDNDILNKRALRLENKWHEAEDALVEAAGGPTWPYFLAAGGVVIGIVGATLYFTTLAR